MNYHRKGGWVAASVATRSVRKFGASSAVLLTSEPDALVSWAILF
jgi:hypothetical protein